MNSTYTIEDMGNRLLLFGKSIPVDEYAALMAKWDERGLKVMLPGVSRALGAAFAVCAEDEVEKWITECRAKAQERADGDPELAWFYGPDAGISSLTIFSVLSKHRQLLSPEFQPSVPHDPADFGRCHLLLEAFPAWRARLSEVAQQHPR